MRTLKDRLKFIFTLLLVTYVIVSAYLLYNRDVLNRIHDDIFYALISSKTPDWIHLWYKPE